MRRTIALTIVALAIAACGGERPPESTYGSTDTVPARTDTTNTQYGGTSATDTTTTNP